MKGIYQPISVEEVENGRFSLTSTVLNLELHLIDNDEIRLFNRHINQYLHTYDEAAARIAELEARLRALGEDID